MGGLTARHNAFEAGAKYKAPAKKIQPNDQRALVVFFRLYVVGLVFRPILGGMNNPQYIDALA